MSDNFTLKHVKFTPELGMALKNFRIEKGVPAKRIINNFHRASSFVSKLEKGDIKKIDSVFFIELCNFITSSENGVDEFLNKTIRSYSEYTDETKLIIMNIDDLLIEYPVPPQLIIDINDYLIAHELSVEDLTTEINSNKDIQDRKNYSDVEKNIWCIDDKGIDDAFIKLSISSTYIDDLLSGKIYSIHRVIVEAILYSLYKLGNEEQARGKAFDKLKIYNLLPARRVIPAEVTDSNDVFDRIEPDAAKALHVVTSGLKAITAATEGYGSKRIKQIADNMKGDLSFSFAYMSVNIVDLEKKDKEKKKQFLNELRILVEKYSQDETSIDLYE